MADLRQQSCLRCGEFFFTATLRPEIPGHFKGGDERVFCPSCVANDKAKNELVSGMADEIRQEVDAEIMEDLKEFE